MTPAPSQAAPLLKEARALLPTFVACGVALLLSALTPGGMPRHIVLVLFCAGAIALGAQSFGLEYAHRTLGLLLSQPADRRRVFLVKTAVLAGMVLALTLAVALVPDPGVRVAPGRRTQTTLLIFGALSAVCVAPWLSMLCRGVLPGIVFTVAIPGLLALAGEVAGVVTYGFRNQPAVESFRLDVMWWGMSIICAVAAISGWRLFMRLEAIDGHAEIQMPAWWRGRAAAHDGPAAVRIRNPAWLLLGKELRLQQMTFVVVGLYVLAWTAVTMLERLAPEFPRVPLEALTALYLGLLAILIGSLGSAEERHLGTLPWQTLLPMAAWKQWTVKAATTIGLAVLFGIALPVVLTYLFAPGEASLPRRGWREPLTALVVITSISLYVSSLCSSGVRAMVVSLPAVVGTAVYTLAFGGIVWTTSYRVSFDQYMAATGIGTGVADRARWAEWVQHSLRVTSISKELMMFAFLALAVVVLRFGYSNHKTIERSTTRIVLQSATLFLFLTLCLLMPIAIWGYYSR